MDLQYNKTDSVVLPITNTRISASEYNQIAGSLMQIITSAGLTPDGGDNTQLLNAIKSFIVGTVVETYSNGTSWYRIWSDGWCEQGGYSSSSNITFLQQMANTNYTISIGNYRNGSATSSDFRYVTAYSVSGFTKVIDSNESFWWRVAGQKAY